MTTNKISPGGTLGESSGSANLSRCPECGEPGPHCTCFHMVPPDGTRNINRALLICLGLSKDSAEIVMNEIERLRKITLEEDDVEALRDVLSWIEFPDYDCTCGTYEPGCSACSKASAIQRRLSGIIAHLSTESNVQGQIHTPEK